MKEKHIEFHSIAFIATLLVAGSFIVSDNITKNIHPLSLTLLRFIGAATILLPFILFHTKLRSKIYNILPKSLVISFFYSIFFICLFEALHTTSSLNTGSIYTLVPIITAFLNYLILHEKITLNTFSAYIIGFIGAIFVIFEGDYKLILKFSLNIGDYIFLVGVFSMGFYSISLKLFYKNDNMILLLFCILISGSFWMLIALLITDTPLNWHLIDYDSIMSILYLIIFSTIITVYFYQKSTVIIGPRKVTAYIYLIPLFIVLILSLVGKYSISLSVVPGIIISIFSTIIIQINRS